MGLDLTSFVPLPQQALTAARNQPSHVDPRKNPPPIFVCVRFGNRVRGLALPTRCTTHFHRRDRIICPQYLISSSAWPIPVWAIWTNGAYDDYNTILRPAGDHLRTDPCGCDRPPARCYSVCDWPHGLTIRPPNCQLMAPRPRGERPGLSCYAGLALRL